VKHGKHVAIVVVAAAVFAALLTLWGGGPREARSASQPPGGPRIVALSPALAVMLRDLGLGDHVVGRHGFDLVLDKSVPVCGDQGGIDYEKLLGVHPTHVLLQWGERELPEKLSRLAEQRGWIVRSYTVLSLEDIVATTARLETLFGVDDPISPTLPESWSREGRMWDGRVLLLGATRPPGVLGPGSFHHDLLVSLGGVPAVTEGAAWQELDAEDVLRLAPDGIIIFRPRPMGVAPDERSWDDLVAGLGRVGELDIPAVREQHIAVIDHPLGLLPSTSARELADELERVLAEWRGE